MSEPAGASVESLGRSRYRVTRGDDMRTAYAVTQGRNVWVWLDGRAYLVQGEDDEENRPGRVDELAMSAPMPATVRAVAVRPGQHVSAGEVLVVLEAMKMELAIKAAVAGVVRAIHCAPGELVQPGVALVELE